MALEFRSYKDDAWYDARVVTEGSGGRRLRIKFFNFGDDEDEVVHAKHLKKLEDVDALRTRFRKISIQFQDSDCSRVEPGLLVCAARHVGPNDRKFYDAILKEVVHEEHRFVGVEQVCTCSFILDWNDSAEPGSCTIENICRVQNTADEELDPALISFLDQAREKIESTFCNPVRISSATAYDLRKRRKETSPSKGSLALSSSVEGMSNFSNHLRISCEAAYDLKNRRKDTISSRGSLALSCYVEGMNDNPSDMGEQDDMDIGGVPYMVIVENLEKGISPFTIMEFVYQQVSITCQASVSPSKSSESYTCGIILLDSKKNLDKLSDFLESPDHIIISSTGRPWLMTEKKPVPETLRASTETLRASIQAFILVSQTALESRTVSSNELDVVISGSREYMKAKELKNLFKEFSKHQCGLHRRLLLEEGKISKMYL